MFGFDITFNLPESGVGVSEILLILGTIATGDCWYGIVPPCIINGELGTIWSGESERNDDMAAVPIDDEDPVECPAGILKKGRLEDFCKNIWDVIKYENEIAMAFNLVIFKNKNAFNHWIFHL